MIKSKTKHKELINPMGEWIKMKLSFRLLIQLQEYNKSLDTLLGALYEDENYHILSNLHEKDKKFSEGDLYAIMDRINKICDAGLEGKDRNWEIASNGNFYKPEENN